MDSSKAKLFVAGLSSRELQKDEGNEREEQVLEMCTKVADRCGDHFYFCFIPHPEAWDELDVEEYDPPIWVLHDGKWRECEL